MSFDIQRARPLLQNCELPKLFIEELGWEPCRQKLALRVGGIDYTFTALAEKRGFIAWLCEAPSRGLPDHPTRLKLDRKLSETSFEHLIVFVTSDRSRQSWMWVRREPGKPLAARTHEYHHGQPGDSLLQKLQVLYVSLEEEEAGLSTIVVAGRARAAFDIERVTKAFYRDFDAHRKAFLKFIEGIGEVADREWYTSVMLNRLMFTYFIQRKGFLDNDRNYLRNRLDQCKKEKGKDKFYTFYRYFLLRLFHEGFGKRRKDRAPDLEKLLGNIPYLNGGLFDVHELEKPDRYGKDIQIPDKAFERVFDYFDQYQWHLDERPLRKDDEINPDVLGYIFEKYINQKQMGAYYSKEDITEYIGKSTVLPFLFDAARTRCKVAFENTAGPTIWDLLRENPDRYIYPAVRHGAYKKLPQEIAAGLDTKKPNLIERRSAWNKPASGDYALPTENWREVVARRLRYEEVRKKLAAGEIREINDFITLNLDLRQFAQDVIQNCEGPDLLMAFWQAITTITVLDPTGGSGAFIFAALNILESLYEACLDRMEAFLAEWGENGRKAHPNYHKKFTEVLARVDAHPNRRYFVLKSIILNNLYAVDIMEEAVEICKLRLFLKLAAQVEPDSAKDNLGIEPLPDIDFNVRAGNTLVGYATADEVRRAFKEESSGQGKLSLGDTSNAYKRFEDQLQIVDAAFRSFRLQQTELGGIVTAQDKAALRAKLRDLDEELNRHLASEYGVKSNSKAAYAAWIRNYQPFHWFVQFYGILNSGGFDVIIGNPPYVETNKVDYVVKGFKSVSCGDLYALCMERSAHLLRQTARFGMIVPISIVSTDGFSDLRNCLKPHYSQVWILNFAERPAKLFTGVEKRLTIWLSRQGVEKEPQLYLSNYKRWMAEERDVLFQKNQFVLSKDNLLVGEAIPKICTELESSILTRIATNSPLAQYFTTSTPHVIYYTRKLRYFVQFFDFIPMIKDSKGRKVEPSELKDFRLSSEAQKEVAISVLNSSLFFWFFCAFSDVRNVNKREILAFRCSLDKMNTRVVGELRRLSRKLMKDFDKNSRMLTGNYGDYGILHIQSFQPRLSKPIIDEIDSVLATHYELTEEELDYIANYDVKYRIGIETEDSEE
ncbi:MAG: Eco57I restriction-modification methylase domain-containing protein [Nitrospirota bacterium]